MGDFEFTAEDLDGVARKLDEVGEQLTEKERGIMLAVFQLAGDRVTSGEGVGDDVRRVPKRPPVFSFNADSDRLPRLSEGFRGSFDPGAPAGVLAADDVSVGVTVGVMF